MYIVPGSRVGLAVLSTAVVASSVLLAQPESQSKEAADGLARAIFRELVEIPTTAEQGATPKASQAIVTRLIAAGFAPADAQVLGPNAGAPCVVARYRGSDPGARPILFMAHMDVVPARREDWSVDPWTLLERDGWFYGRGTSDNKTGVTSLVANFVRLRSEGWRPRRDLIAVLTG
ncbi:MAG: M20/M25/M40 family metallo-hydrolase, partial [Vicinamibacterales bacterium]